MATCSHLDLIDYDAVEPEAPGCVDCLATGGRWVHLRACQTCGRVGCCDSSPARHARAHAASTGHVVIRSYEPGEGWFFCYSDKVTFELVGAPPPPSYAQQGTTKA